MIDEEIKDLMISQEEWENMFGNDGVVTLEDNTRWVLGISVAGHGGSGNLLKDQRVVFYLKEERCTRYKRDSRTPFKCLEEIKNYTNELDRVISVNMSDGNIKRSLNYLNKLNIKVKSNINQSMFLPNNRYVFGSEHHVLHASCGYHLSPFDEATAVVIDGWGWSGEARRLLNEIDPYSYDTYGSIEDELRFGVRVYDHCSIWSTGPTPDDWKLLWKEVSSDYTRNCNFEGDVPSIAHVEQDYRKFYTSVPGCEDTEIHLAQPMSVPVCYESVTCFLGFHQEDVGKTMGLSCYGKPNDEIPSFLIDNEWKDTSDLVAGNILLNTVIYPQLRKYHADHESSFEQKADLAYAIQKDLEKKVICVVERAMRMNDCKNIVLSGGVFHNVMINELLTSKYPDYNFFADPLCDDAGQSYGAAMWYDKVTTGICEENTTPKSMYLGPRIPKDELKERVINAVDKYNCPVL